MPLERVELSGPPPEVRRACERLAADMRIGEATPAQHEALVVALTAYDLDKMTALRDRGCKVVFEKNLDGGNFTCANPAEWHVRLGSSLKPALLHGVLLHELGHALDCLKGEQEGAWDGAVTPDAMRPFASQQTPSLVALQDRFQLRAAVDVAPYALAQLDKADEYIASAPGKAYIGWAGGEMGIESEHRDGRRNVRLEGVPLPANATVGQVETFAVSGGEARLEILAADVARVDIPENYRPEMTWSAYAASKNDLPEFFAEAVSHYLFSDAQRENLRRTDPEVAAWVESLGLEAAWRRNARSVPTPEGARLELFVDAMDVAQDDRVAGLEAYYSAVLPRRNVTP